MSLKFYYLSGSPFSWKVWLALEHKALYYDLRVLSADAGDLKTPDFLKINPRGKVPAIVDGTFTLYESGPIVEYLEDKYPQSGAPLWPKDPATKALARRVSDEASTYVYPHVRKLMLELVMRRDGLPDLKAIEDAKAQLVSELSYLGLAMSGEFVAGPDPTAADYALYPLTAIIDRIQTRNAAYDISSVVPACMRGWMSRVEDLPYFAKTTPPHWKTS
jgi:glutathione S-transferase